MDEAEPRLIAMLTEAGLEPERLNAHATWRVFKAFASMPIDDLGADPDNDMLLNEYCTREYENIEGRHFEWSLVRQFTLHDTAGEYDHMEHLRCLLLIPANPTTDKVRDGGGLFLPTTYLDAFVSEVEQSEAFAALPTTTAAASWVFQERV